MELQSSSIALQLCHLNLEKTYKLEEAKIILLKQSKKSIYCTLLQ